jgi:hypothetical protein
MVIAVGHAPPISTAGRAEQAGGYRCRCKLSEGWVALSEAIVQQRQLAQALDDAFSLQKTEKASDKPLSS